MSGIRETSSCKHVIIQDSGYEVCIKCAYVCGNVFSFSELPSGFKEKTCDDDTPTFFKTKISQILELESRGLIPNIIVEHVKILIKEWHKKKIPHQKYHHAYAVYIAARKNNHPITLKEIAYYLQIELKNVCKIEKFLNYTFNDSPFDYLSKYCGLLNLTFADEKIVRFFLTEFYTQSGISPAHIAAGAIFATFPKIKLQELSKISWTATSTIKKIATQLRARVFL